MALLNLRQNPLLDLGQFLRQPFIEAPVPILVGAGSRASTSEGDTGGHYVSVFTSGADGGRVKCIPIVAAAAAHPVGRTVGFPIAFRTGNL